MIFLHNYMTPMFSSFNKNHRNEEQPTSNFLSAGYLFKEKVLKYGKFTSLATALGLLK